MISKNSKGRSEIVTMNLSHVTILCFDDIDVMLQSNLSPFNAVYQPDTCEVRCSRDPQSLILHPNPKLVKRDAVESGGAVVGDIIVLIGVFVWLVGK